MARRIETDQITGIRDGLIERTALLLDRMYESNADLFPYRGAEIRRLKLRLHQLKTGNDLLIYRFEIPTELQSPRDEGHLFTLKGDTLCPPEYEQVTPRFDNRS